MDKDPEDHNVIIQATAYVPIETHPHSLASASACASHFPAEVASIRNRHPQTGSSVETHYPFFYQP